MARGDAPASDRTKRLALIAATLVVCIRLARRYPQRGPVKHLYG